jgi:hypothetical protein
MDEPRGRTIDGKPWPEARGPHLPDRLTALPWPTLFFGSLAIVMTALAIRGVVIAGPTDALSIGYAISGAIPTAVAFLLPATLFFRHRDVWQSNRLLVVGTVLFGVVEILQYISPGISEWLSSVIAPPADLPFLAPLDIAFNVVVGIISALAPIYVGRGLIAARVYEDEPGTRKWWLVVAALTLVAGVTNVLMLINLSLDIPADAVMAYYWLTVLSVAISLLSLFGWAYFAGAAVVGWRSGESPSRAWGLASLGGGLILVGLTVSGVIGAIGVFGAPLPNELSILILGAFALGYLVLLAAFLIGLPDDPDEAPKTAGR